MASNDDDSPSIQFGDYEKTDRTELPRKVTVTEAIIRSYIEGNFDGSPDAYKPGNTGIEPNANGSNHLGDYGHMIAVPIIGTDGKQKTDKYGKLEWIEPYGIDWEHSTIHKELKDRFNDIYIPSQQPHYQGYKGHEADLSKIINPKDVCFLVHNCVPGGINGDIVYIERLESYYLDTKKKKVNPNRGRVML